MTVLILSSPSVLRRRCYGARSARKKRSQSAQQKSQGTEQRSPRHRLGCCIRRLLCLFFGFGNRFFVLLLVLLNLSPGLIGRDILRLGQSISSFIRCSGLLSGVS